MKIGQSSRDMNSASLKTYCKASNFLSLNELAIFLKESKYLSHPCAPVF